MEIIELNDWKYEIQYIDDMIRILNPFIRFKFNKDGELDIFKKGSGLLIEEKITTKEFINFIQYTFPEIVREEIKKVAVDHGGRVLDLRKSRNLRNLEKLIPHKLGTINNVLQFLENLQYSNSF